MIIYHNPRCSKSRNGLKYLQEKGFDFEIKNYLAQGLSVEELKSVINKTGKKPFDFVRTQENEYKEKYKGKTFSDDEWVQILVKNPRLLQRPIVVNGGKAILANPPENIGKII